MTQKCKYCGNKINTTLNTMTNLQLTCTTCQNIYSEAPTITKQAKSEIQMYSQITSLDDTTQIILFQNLVFTMLMNKISAKKLTSDEILNIIYTKLNELETDNHYTVTKKEI